LKVLIGAAGEGWRRSVGPIVWEIKLLHGDKEGRSLLPTTKEGRLTRLAKCLLIQYIEGKIEGARRRGKRRKHYWMTLI
jgi:hypothetical protein